MAVPLKKFWLSLCAPLKFRVTDRLRVYSRVQSTRALIRYTCSHCSISFASRKRLFQSFFEFIVAYAIHLTFTKLTYI